MSEFHLIKGIQSKSGFKPSELAQCQSYCNFFIVFTLDTIERFFTIDRFIWSSLLTSNFFVYQNDTLLSEFTQNIVVLYINSQVVL